MRKTIHIHLIKRAVTDWGKVLVLLLDEAAVATVVILALWFLRIQIPLPVTIAIATVGGIFVLVIHIAMIPSFHRKQVTGREGIIGMQGRVTKSLTPFGTILINSERWKAKSIDENVGVDENVEIVGIEGLTLEVKRKSHQLN